MCPIKANGNRQYSGQIFIPYSKLQECFVTVLLVTSNPLDTTWQEQKIWERNLFSHGYFYAHHPSVIALLRSTFCVHFSYNSVTFFIINFKYHTSIHACVPYFKEHFTVAMSTVIILYCMFYLNFALIWCILYLLWALSMKLRYLNWL